MSYLPHRAPLVLHRGQGTIYKVEADQRVLTAMRADAMLDKGDLDGYAVWKRILRAVAELQGTVPKPGEAVH